MISGDLFLLGITMPGGGELLLILLIVLVVFGHNRIPQLGEALGKGIRNFRKSFSKDDETEAEASHREVRPLAEDRAPTVDEQIRTVDPETVKHRDDAAH